MCLAQGHSKVPPLRFEPAAPRSRFKHSTTEPLCSLPEFGEEIIQFMMVTCITRVLPKLCKTCFIEIKAIKEQ